MGNKMLMPNLSTAAVSPGFSEGPGLSTKLVPHPGRPDPEAVTRLTSRLAQLTATAKVRRDVDGIRRLALLAKRLENAIDAGNSVQLKAVAAEVQAA